MELSRFSEIGAEIRRPRCFRRFHPVKVFTKFHAKLTLW